MLFVNCALIFVVTLYHLKNLVKIKSVLTKLIYIQIMFNCFIKFLQGYMNIPSVTNYITDIITIIICLIYLIDKRKKEKVPLSLQIVFFIYLFVTVSSFFANMYSPLIYIWGFRNNMRFIIFSMMCTVCLEIKDIKNILEILFSYFVLNIFAITYEFFFAGLTFRTGDIISGLYSVKTSIGGNGDLNWLICIISAYAMIQYLNKEKNIIYLLFCLVAAVYMAALSELKIFFVEIILISIISVGLCKKSFKLVLFCCLCTVVFIIGLSWLYTYFPQFNDFFALENLQNALFSTESYNNQNGMSRSGAMKYVLINFLTNTPDRIIGIGFGNADCSGFDSLTSEFYKKNSYTSYQWFYAPFILIETGFLGLIAYMNIIFNFIKKSLFCYIKKEKYNNFINLSIIVGVLSFIMMFYNASMKTETSGYLVFLLLSISYIVDKSKDLKDENNNR